MTSRHGRGFLSHLAGAQDLMVTIVEMLDYKPGTRVLNQTEINL
jgi:hypothetical protein